MISTLCRAQLSLQCNLQVHIPLLCVELNFTTAKINKTPPEQLHQLFLWVFPAAKKSSLILPLADHCPGWWRRWYLGDCHLICPFHPLSPPLASILLSLGLLIGALHFQLSFLKTVSVIKHQFSSPVLEVIRIMLWLYGICLVPDISSQKTWLKFNL